MQNNEKKVVELNINDVLPNRFQPRIKFDENSINELALSIKKYGVIQPIVVRKIGEKYEIIAGERRYKASVIAGKATIPAIICEFNDIDSVEIALIENVQREDLTPIEKAISYKKILDMGYINQEDLAQKVGKSQSSIANTLRLLNLTDEVQEALLENKISERHARSLLKIKDAKKQTDMLKKIIDERLTVRKTDEEIDKMYNNLEENNNPQTIENQPNPISEEIVTIPDVEGNNLNNSYMPGFMDIDKIATEAKDINEEPKEPVDMANLLQGDPNFVPTQESNNNQEDLLRPGKFFNFFDEESKTDKVEESAGQFNFENFFNPMGSNSSSDLVTTLEVASQPEMPSVPTYETNTPEVAIQPEIPSVPTYEMNTPEVAIQPEIPSVPTYEMNTPEAAIQPEIPSVPTYETNTSEVAIQPEIPAYAAPSQMDITQDNSSMPAYAAPMQPEINMPIPPTIDVVNTPVVDNYATEPIAMPETSFNNPVPVAAPNIRLALNTIRECETTLNKYGFNVDVEEIDFEDSYQVIFKISK